MKDDRAEEQPEVKPERKPYTPPRIEESGRFEHLVLACGMAMGGPPMCLFGGERSIS